MNRIAVSSNAETRLASPGTAGCTAESWVETDLYGRVTAASAKGARLFNLSVRGLTGRNLSLFFEDRQAIADGLRQLRCLLKCAPFELEYRPLECRARRVRVSLASQDGEAIRWTLNEVFADAAVTSPA